MPAEVCIFTQISLAVENTCVFSVVSGAADKSTQLLHARSIYSIYMYPHVVDATTASRPNLLAIQIFHSFQETAID